MCYDSKNDHEICPKCNIKGSQTIFYSCTVIQMFRIHMKPYQVFIQRSSSTTSVATVNHAIFRNSIFAASRIVMTNVCHCMLFGSHVTCHISYFRWILYVSIYIMVHGYKLLPLYIFLPIRFFFFFF